MKRYSNDEHSFDKATKTWDGQSPAGNGAGTVNSAKPFTPAYSESQLDQMSWEYYHLSDSLGLPPTRRQEERFMRRWGLNRQQLEDLLEIFNQTNRTVRRWENEDQSQRIITTEDYLVIGEGGVVALNSQYGEIILGRRLKSIMPRSGIGSIAGLIARVFTSNPDVIAAIETFGDLIEAGLSGFVVARSSIEHDTDPSLVRHTPQDGRRTGNGWRDELADLMRQQLAGTGNTVHVEEKGAPITKDTPFGKRFIDIEIRDGSGRPIGGIEAKAGNSRYTREQRSKDKWLRLTQNYIVNVVRTH
jgi:hypothetical protein